MKEKTKILLRSMATGKLLFRLGADRYLPHILFFFVLCMLYIWINLGFDNTMHHMEENKKVIANLKSLHTEIYCKLTGLDSVCKVEDMLREMGSEVKIPVKQAVIIRKDGKK